MTSNLLEKANVAGVGFLSKAGLQGDKQGSSPAQEVLGAGSTSPLGQEEAL